MDLLTRMGHSLPPTIFVKLMFLMRHETCLEENPSFYDFVPYKYGPFSFTLYWDLDNLRQNGYLLPDEKQISLCPQAINLCEEKTDELPASIQSAVRIVLTRYGKMNQDALIRSVYSRYPWFAFKSELKESSKASILPPKKAVPAVYTAGYEGMSVDTFFNNLMNKGIEVVIDVRANPISRKYGFSGRRFPEICKTLGFEYIHVPNLGIPPKYRAGLGTFESYQRLLNQYEQTMLPKQPKDVEKVGRLMRRKPSVLVCVEKDIRCCHRSPLAEALAKKTNLQVIHL
ncbi:MAG: DUF488 domain-containing protein [Planctomycetes bacterium]|nr:DUF488 domain-containing protein [Planctomycetota bacterium]